MNKNKIFTEEFTNPLAMDEYWQRGEKGIHPQCCMCQHFVEFNCDWGLCCLK